MPDRPLRHAVVAGGSIAGLLAARVLSRHFERVTLIEREALARTPEPRRAVPQGRHVHALLIRGRSVLEEFFPGLETQLRSQGAELLNAGRDIRWHHSGDWRIGYDSDLWALSMSRPLLESALAQRVRDLPNVIVRDGTRVEGLTSHGEGSVSGLHIGRPGDRSSAEDIEADLVVDAMGRGSTVPQWLATLGCAGPRAELLPTRVAYASCTFPRLDQDKRAVFITGAASKRAGAVFPIEGNRWLATMVSFFDEPTLQDHAALLDFAGSLGVSEIHDVVRAGGPLSRVAHHRFPGSLRRRYEALDRLPDGLIALGDAVCSFNPVYGQGMTVSALEAGALDRELARAASESGGLAVDFGRRWFRAIKPVIDAAWDGLLLEDLRFPELAGHRPARIGPLQWYMDRVHRATHRSPPVADQFYRAVNFVDPPAKLFRPRILADVLCGGWAGSRPARHAAPELEA